MSTGSADDERPQDKLARLKAELQAIYDTGADLLAGNTPGLQVASMLAERLGRFVRARVDEALESRSDSDRVLLEERSAVVAVGGSGRGELSFASDFDLALLYTADAKAVAEPVFSAAVRDCWDAGLEVGHRMQTFSGAISDAKSDFVFATALVHQSLLFGSEERHAEFRRTYERVVVRKHYKSFFRKAVTARKTEWDDHGGRTVSQLEPDVKKSRGGLRDLHALRWLGFAIFGSSDLDTLRLGGRLRRNTERKLRRSYDWLLRLRLDMHRAGATDDKLTRETQLRFAEERGIEAPEGRRPVEAFMGEYFEHASILAETLDAFVEVFGPRPFTERLLDYLLMHRVDRIYFVSHRHLHVRSPDLPQVSASYESHLDLFRTAALHQVVIDSATMAHLRASVPTLEGEPSREAYDRFVDIFRRSKGLPRTLRDMDRVGLLVRILPEWQHVQFLLQFNQYHHYTVDEHTFRVLEAAEKLLTDPGPLGTVYRSIKRKDVLHLALLLHDAGKGYGVDHSEKGAELAEVIGERIGLAEHQVGMLTYLVLHHLNLSHLAFRRNYMDPKALFEFASEVGSSEVLKMLYVLTACDTTGVGPGVWTEWKAGILHDVYERLLRILTGVSTTENMEECITGSIDRVRDLLSESGDAPASLAEQLRSTTPHYVMATTPEQIAADLRELPALLDGGVRATAEFQEESETTAYRVIVHPSLTDGCFHRICGALSAHRHRILEAEIVSLADGTAIDRFVTIDGDFKGRPPEGRADEVCEYIEGVVRGEIRRSELKRKTKKSNVLQEVPLVALPTRVEVDNKVSEGETVISVFTTDRPGLLYQLTRTMSIENLDVKVAKIATHLDQVCDVFYVTEESGEKIRDGERIRSIKEFLTDCIEELDDDA